MSDIEEQLRDAARFLDELEDFPELQIGAADEITRLREENARLSSKTTLLRELLDDVWAQWDGDCPEELVARVKATIDWNKGGHPDKS